MDPRQGQGIPGRISHSDGSRGVCPQEPEHDHAVPVGVKHNILPLLLLLLLFAPLAAEQTQTPEQELRALTDLGAYWLVDRWVTGQLDKVPTQTLKGMVALPAEQRWLIPVEALSALAGVRASESKILKMLDPAIEEAHKLQLAEQELALRVLALRACDSCDLPKELRQRLPAALELARQVKTPRGKILAFQVASLAFMYTHSPSNAQVWTDGYARASAMLPREPLPDLMLRNSGGLWLGTGDCLVEWARLGHAAGVGKPFQDKLERDVSWLLQHSSAALKGVPPSVEPFLASLWVSIRAGTPELQQEAWKYVQELKGGYQSLEAKLARWTKKATCLDELDGIGAHYHLARIKTGQALPEELQLARAEVASYGSPDLILALTEALTEQALSSKQPDLAERYLKPVLEIRTMTRVHRSLLLTLSARAKLAANETNEAKALLFEARMLQLDYLAERGGTKELDALYFKPTIDLMKQLQMQL